MTKYLIESVGSASYKLTLFNTKSGSMAVYVLGDLKALSLLKAKIKFTALKIKRRLHS